MLSPDGDVKDIVKAGVRALLKLGWQRVDPEPEPEAEPAGDIPAAGPEPEPEANVANSDPEPEPEAAEEKPRGRRNSRYTK